MRPRRAATISSTAALAAGAAIVALALGQWPAGEAPSPLFEPRPEASAGGVRAEGPSAADESGIALPQQPRSIVAAPPSDRSPQRTPLTRTPPARPRPARLQPPRQPKPDGGPASQGKALPPAAAHGTGAAQGTGATPTTPGGTAPPAAPGPGQGALPQSGAPDPVSPAAAPPALQPATVPPPASQPATVPPPVAVVPSAPVFTPPVPVDLSPPKHLLPYRMVVDAPGLAATARLEAVEARVRLRVTVRADGTVGRVEIAVPSGRPELDAAALEAARQWRFLPARRNDEPIESVALIWVAFIVEP